MEQTGTWIWPDTYSDLKTIEFKPADLKYIKTLLVAWDVTEMGAPSFMKKNGEWLFDVFEDEHKKEWLLSLFVNKASLSKAHRKINNPFLNNLSQDIIDEALYGLKDKESKKLLLNEETIEIDIDDKLQKIWDSCSLGSTGFDPKRGFRLSNLQEIIDPEKILSKAQITKEKTRYKGLLFLYLQLFVQQAELETGFYHSFDGWNWIKGKDYKIEEQLTKYEWWRKINSDYFNEISDYIHLSQTLPSIEKHLSVKQAVDYNKIAEIFNLDNLFRYDYDNIYRADISLEEILLKSLESFPQEKTISKNQDEYPFILLLVRIYNAQARFQEAQKLLKENNLDVYTEKQLDFFCSLPNKYLQIAFYESCICRMGITKNYDSWRFPEYPKFTEKEIEKYELSTGVFFLNDPEQKKIYNLEQKKIKLLLKERGTLDFDLRDYLHYSYRDNLSLIFEDLDKKKTRQDLDEILVSIVGQIFILK